ncbi:TPA: hypothetical protein RNS97_001060 [Stenotrophomonas maltophilia]|nr:hypothetical protein [Stenotrophomonas maltophilia]HDX0845805.1 hypothetical protein [Stenotrophomonas maltophilia]
MAARDHERYVELVLLSDDSVDLVVRAIAGAFGFGVPTRPAVRLASRRRSSEESCPDEGAYLPIHRVHSIEQAASKYLPAQAAARKQALETFSPKDRQAVLDFDQMAVMRSRAAADRTRQLRRWKAQGSLTAAPAKGPSRLVLHALADAQLDGPLGAWLMLYAIGDQRVWPVVCRHMTACGHPDWASLEAARRLLAGRHQQSYRDAAKDHARQEARFRREVQSAERRLLEWLGRASRRVAAEMGSACE